MKGTQVSLPFLSEIESSKPYSNHVPKKLTIKAETEVQESEYHLQVSTDTTPGNMLHLGKRHASQDVLVLP
jgi:hypothetical protein